MSLILMSIFYNNNRAINYLSLRVESTTVCVQETPKTIELMLEFECLSTKLNAKMRKILSGCTYYKYWLIKKLIYLCKAHTFLLFMHKIYYYSICQVFMHLYGISRVLSNTLLLINSNNTIVLGFFGHPVCYDRLFSKLL